MNQTINILRSFFYAPIAIALLFVALYETDTLMAGGLEMDAQGAFMLTSAMQLLTLAVIPGALYLFKSKPVSRELKSQPATALRRYGILRLLMLGAPLVANTLLYYMTMSPGYGYMAIILLIAMTFVYPTRQRCQAETSTKE